MPCELMIITKVLIKSSGIFHYRTITIPGTESIFSYAFMQSNIINKKILSLQRSRNNRLFFMLLFFEIQIQLRIWGPNCVRN